MGRRKKIHFKTGKPFHQYRPKRNSWPEVRGVAMNPFEYLGRVGNHQHIGHASTARRDAPPAQRGGLLTTRRTGRLRGQVTTASAAFPVAQGSPNTNKVNKSKSEEDVSFGIEIWKNAVYGYILGADPPKEDVEGYLRRIWGNYKISHISFLINGMFIVRFDNEEHLRIVLEQGGGFVFDNKPVIIKPWVENVELTREIARLCY